MVRNFIYLPCEDFSYNADMDVSTTEDNACLLIETDRIRSRESDNNLSSADDKQTRSGHGSHGCLASHGRVSNKWSASNSSRRRFLASLGLWNLVGGTMHRTRPIRFLRNEAFSSLVDLPCQSRVPLGTRVGNSVGPVTLSRHQSCLVLRPDSPSKDSQNYSDQTSYVIHVLRAVKPSIFMSRDRIQQKIYTYIYMYMTQNRGLLIIELAP